MSSSLQKSVLVYDVGGSHVSCAVCLENSYQLGGVVSAPHPAEKTANAFIQFLYSLGVEASAGFARVSGAELAVPGPFDFDAGMSQMQHKLPYIYGVDLRLPLAERFGWSADQIRFLNDADAFLLGEIGAGAARSVNRAVGITLGTGIGSAFAIDGCVVTNGPGIPPGGELWNLPFRDGIVEDFVSARAIQRSYERRTGRIRDVAELAADGATDPSASAAFVEFGRDLALALAVALVEFAPNLVVLGGGIARAGHLFLPAARQALQELDLILRVSMLLDRAPLAGAGVAWFNSASRVGSELHPPVSVPGCG